MTVSAAPTCSGVSSGPSQCPLQYHLYIGSQPIYRLSVEFRFTDGTTAYAETSAHKQRGAF